MPIRQRIEPAFGSQHDGLKQRLIEEWLRPSEAVGNPIIIEEKSTIAASGQQPSRLYVIWDQWAGMDQLERSGIVLDAYQAARGPQAASMVTFAQGLTADEAAKLGIQY